MDIFLSIGVPIEPSHYWYGISSVESAKNLIHRFARNGYRIVEATCDTIIMVHDITDSTLKLSRLTTSPQEVVNWLHGLEDYLDSRTHAVAMEYIDKE